MLIEKPIATSAREAEEIAAAARSAGVFAAEAMWTRYLPQFDVLDQLLQRGDLGTIRLATAEVGWAIGADAPARMLDPGHGGGAALDMGVYGYWFAQFAIGRPQLIRAVGSVTSTGVDEQTVVAIAGPEGRHAAVTTSMAVTASGLAAIHGTLGSARFLDPFVFPARFVVDIGGDRHGGRTPADSRSEPDSPGRRPRSRHYIDQGRTDSAVHSLDDAIGVLRTIDAVRAQLQSATDPESEPQ